MFYFTSDLHFNHVNILSYTKRPWKSVEEMNEGLISNWNNIVKKEDTVYVLGDFAMGNRKEIPNFLSRLNGEIVLIAGNQDSANSIQYFRNFVHSLSISMPNGKYVELVHNPADAKCEHDYVFCGHVHEEWVIKRKGDILPADKYHKSNTNDKEIIANVPFVNVGVDVQNYRPRTLEELIELLS